MTRDHILPSSRLPASPIFNQSTVQSRRRPDTPSLSIAFPPPPPRREHTTPIITPTRRDSDTLPPDHNLPFEPVIDFTAVPPTRPSRISSRRFTKNSLASQPLAPLVPAPPVPTLDVTVDYPTEAMSYMTEMPPTPTASIHSPSRRASLEKLAQRSSGSVSAKAQLFGGMSPNRIQAGPSSTPHSLPPTPPNNEGDSTLVDDDAQKVVAAVFSIPHKSSSPALASEDPSAPQRERRGRRPVSGVLTGGRESPSPTKTASRCEGDEDETRHLDVKFDAYAPSEFDTEESVLEDREPTLSFLTTSTVESTTGTPSSIAIQYGEDGKARVVRDGEDRVRMRTTTGRSTAYSSAESSMASGAYSYHAYADNNIYHPHPPPLPSMPTQIKLEQVGLGITSPHDLNLPSGSRQSHIESESSIDPNSPSLPYVRRPWETEAVSRPRSGSASTSSSAPHDQEDQVEVEDNTPHPQVEGFAIDMVHYDGLPWDEPNPHSPAEAVTLVEEGKSRIFDKTRLEALGGVEALTGDAIASLGGITHLLLPDVGSSLIDALSRLLYAFAPTLVVLDLSNNDLSFLPETLRHCTSLEELNVSGNPIRSIPTWLAELVEMRVLAVDGCQLLTIPQDLSALGRLHTLCARRNRMVSLPPWLCLLSRMMTLRIDGNPFAPEWQPIVSPILAVMPIGLPASSSSRPQALGVSHAPSQASMSSTQTAASVRSLPAKDESGLESPVAGVQSMYQSMTLGAIDEDQPQSAPAPMTSEPIVDSPDRMTYSPSSPEKLSTIVEPTQGGLRKMRSAGDLLEPRPSTGYDGPIRSPSTKAVHGVRAFSRNMQGNASSSNLVPFSQRSLGSREGSRLANNFTMSNYDESTSPSKHGRPSTSSSAMSSKDKSGKWGFLRKMSMHRLKSDTKNMTAASANANLRTLPPFIHHPHSDQGPSRVTPPPRPPLNPARSAHTFPVARSGADEFGSMPSTPSTIAGATLPQTMPTSLAVRNSSLGSMSRQNKRKSFLAVDTAPSINVAIPALSPIISPTGSFEAGSASTLALPLVPQQEKPLPEEPTEEAPAEVPVQNASAPVPHPGLGSPMEIDLETRYARGLESIKSYLRDLFDLSRPAVEPYGSFEVISAMEHGSDSCGPTSPDSTRESRSSIAEARRLRRPTMERRDTEAGSSAVSVVESERSAASPSVMSTTSQAGAEGDFTTGKKFKNDAAKRARVLREIWETERTYVRGLGELVTIYVKPASQPVNPGKSNETVIPSAERKVVFGGVESILTIHRDNLLPALEKAVKPLLEGKDDEDGQLSTKTAHAFGEVFRTYIAYMKQYSSYINNFDNALSRMKTWSMPSSNPGTPAYPSKPTLGKLGGPNGASVSTAAISVGMGLSSLSLPLSEPVPHSGNQMSASQKKRVKGFLKRCREHPLHSQINLESYLLLPIQRVPRYKLLLEDLAMCTMPQTEGPRDTLDDALNEIASLASLMNEEKRDADSRLRLFHWQKRITSRGPSPLVQPHRRLIMDGALTLIRLVKKSSSFVEVDNTSSNLVGGVGDGDKTLTSSKVVVPVEHIIPEPMDRPIMLILCSDLLALVQQRQGASDEGWDGQVDLFNVLRMGTLREPASIVHGNVLRVVDNKSIYYFNGASQEMILQWSRAINSARRR